jgi:hypothetical protein
MTVATTTSPLVPDERFALPAQDQQLTRAADALARGAAGRGRQRRGGDRDRLARGRVEHGKPDSGVRRGAAHRIWVVGAQKVVPDLDTALRRIETYAYPLEDVGHALPTGTPAR